MATAEVSVTIARPIEEVFAYAVALENYPEWVPVILAAWPSSGNPPAEVGASYMVKARVMGRTMEFPSEVVGYEPNRLYAYKTYGFLTYTDTMTLEENGAGTLVTERLDMRSDDRLARLLDPLKLMISKRSHRRNQKLLKAVLEGG